jgi:hypothetical protein
MPSVFDLLEDVKKRPSMYVGWDSTERGKQLLSLEMLLMGYGHAVERHGVEDPGKDILRELGRYIFKQYGWSVSCGPIAAIRANVKSDDEAWELFWRLLDEFKNAPRLQGSARQQS